MGHIPSNQKEPVTSFQDALKESENSKEYDAGKWLFVPPRYTEYRYILGTKGDRPLICCGVNPSTAAPDNLDNTLKSVERIALANGYDSFQMFNVYAQRATYPKDMDIERDEYLHKQNMEAFRYLLREAAKNGSKPTVWAAWGNIIEMRAYLKNCVQEMVSIGEEMGGVNWVCAGPISKKGNPHHPLYLKKDVKLEPYFF